MPPSRWRIRCQLGRGIDRRDFVYFSGIFSQNAYILAADPAIKCLQPGMF